MDNRVFDHLLERRSTVTLPMIVELTTYDDPSIRTEEERLTALPLSGPLPFLRPGNQELLTSTRLDVYEQAGDLRLPSAYSPVMGLKSTYLYLLYCTRP